MDGYRLRSVTLSLGQVSVAAPVSTVLSMRPDCIAYEGDGQTNVKVIAALRQAGFRGKYITAMGTLQPPFLKSLGKLGNGVIAISTAMDPTSADPGVTAFRSQVGQSPRGHGPGYRRPVGVPVTDRPREPAAGRRSSRRHQGLPRAGAPDGPQGRTLVRRRAADARAGTCASPQARAPPCRRALARPRPHRRQGPACRRARGGQSGNGGHPAERTWGAGVERPRVR